MSAERDPSLLKTVTSASDKRARHRYRNDYEIKELLSWPKMDIPELLTITEGVVLYPALSNEDNSVALRVLTA